MRVFWAFLAVILLAGVGALLMGPGRGGGPERERPRTPQPELAKAALTPVVPTGPPAPASGAPGASAGPTTSMGGAAGVPTAGDIERALDEALGTGGEQTGKPRPPQEAPGDLGEPTGPRVDLAVSAAHPVEKLVRAKAVRLESGELLLDGRFRIKGSGTAADPYEVPFDLLMSAENTFQPRKGLNRLPERVAFLHGSFVTLSGYVAFPISAGDASELLVMFNQWDGCCIGVPPTAYDAVEVKLARAAQGEDRFSVHGRVTGRFKVDPFIDSNYLLGLYVMEDASFSSDRTDAKLRSTHNAP